MLTPHKEHFRGAAESVAKLFLALKFTPNGITLLGLFLSLATCGFFAWNQNPVLFGFLMILWGLFDFIDGAAARLTHRVTRFGSYLDAMCDRVSEFSGVFAAAYVSGHWVLCFSLIGGALLISYAKARAAMEVNVSNTEWPDLMERTERGIIFAVGIIAWGLYPNLIFGHDLFFWVLSGLNVAVYATVVQRVVRARRLIEARA